MVNWVEFLRRIGNISAMERQEIDLNIIQEAWWIIHKYELVFIIISLCILVLWAMCVRTRGIIKIDYNCVFVCVQCFINISTSTVPPKYPLICNVRINVKKNTCLFTRSLKMFIYLIIKQNHEKDAFSC